ncbi:MULTISPECIES: CDP-diacylglycerol--glycerol-3-phosphate 3-phosphatidyltransferase [unclassified Bacillus (in: firmicutes)]|uniref:CDP-diacylglycerol--glycerol-3-phosphate 3-phosphatidyltransferase n=1 Tax=unclassified Bacillus (in: firmicutes) TaxID=185979 RepID=UPI0008F3E305|nr:MULTISPECIES: CDP-diacylglycerol--glycerol-3-phosphate 3-phosphatidyltransferase [unclassified Bacillus (in: firmicutes)]SFI24663.1 CDP-diacylglycerol--glycerol-3-phosphate 3-phosphatidyltransferase [Bacillus sp. 71mf]SFS41499.1 CDP-diacylglycerol--glycerol-3-phosphate 3-phosphatidyltransferase [Bacillus sp. 103mf]
MNLPNKITVSRICLIPIFLIIMLTPFEWGVYTIGDVELPIQHLAGALVFIIASATDWIDGHYARKHNLVTNLGKFLDPLADKLLVSAALITLVDLHYVATWMAVVIISREFAVTGLRLVLAGTGEVAAAKMPGKIKMWMQVIAISAYLLHDVPLNLIHIRIADISIWIALIFTIISGWDYFWKNRGVFVDSK